MKFLYIYEIVNMKNQVRYIGSTVNFDSRKNQHKKSLRNKRHHNRRLQNAWNKYGEDYFRFTILRKYPSNDIKNRDIIEQSYIDRYNFRMLYNSYKKVATYPQNKKLSSIQKPVMKIKRNKPVALYPSIAEAARQNNLSTKKISDAINGRRKIVSGYIWKTIRTDIFIQ